MKIDNEGNKVILLLYTEIEAFIIIISNGSTTTVLSYCDQLKFKFVIRSNLFQFIRFDGVTFRFFPTF